MSVKELLSEVLPIIEENAPTIATAIASPIVGVPELALSVLSEAFGTHVTSPSALKNQIKMPSTTTSLSGLGKLGSIQEEHGDNFKKIMSNNSLVKDDDVHTFSIAQDVKPKTQATFDSRKITLTIEY